MIKITKELVWNVYWEDFNAREIKVKNVFNHGSFYEEIMKLLKNKDITLDEFSELLRKEAMYYFWSRSEYEVVIVSFPPYISKKELERLNSEECKYRTYVNPEIAEKIDIYDQLRLNWDVFVNYVWSFRKVNTK